VIVVKHLEEKLQWVPDRPGVYLMRDDGGEVIYVGKASSLKARLRSYFGSLANQGAKVQSMVSHIRDFEYIVTDTEIEALILEYNLIKKHRPRYNVMFRDDKSYPYLKVSLNADWPGMSVTRIMSKDGARYFGPYTRVGALNDTVRLLRRIFPIRTCKESVFARGGRACLNAHIKRCMGPCTGEVKHDEYMEAVKEVILFMEGRQDDVLRRLKRRMEEASSNLHFERAAELRDQVRAVEAVLEKQKIVSPDGGDQDVIALARGASETCVQVFFIRQGKLVGRDHFFLDRNDHVSRGEVMAAFLKQYYGRAAEIPPEIIISESIEDRETIVGWLSEMRGKKVRIHIPKRGRKLQLVKMAAENALMELREYEEDLHKKKMSAEKSLLELQEHLGLGRLPLRIECYDISNISGANAVGSMVVFEKGVPKKSQYRRFKIRTVSGPDDYASLQEVLKRRFKPAGSSQKGEEGAGDFANLPDLIVIDGGKGQLSAAREVMREMGVEQIPAYGLAKRQEELFAAGEPVPIKLPRGSQSLMLLQRIRDEAHRFAVTYHRHLRSAEAKKSILDDIPGVGPKKKRALLRRFGSVEGIRQASVDEIREVKGINRELAEKICWYLEG